MRVDVLTIFPEVFPGPLSVGVVGRAIEAGALEVVAHDLRAFAEGRHRQVDDVPFGGGPGMVMKPEPLVRAVRELRGAHPGQRSLLLGPQGRLLDQELVRELGSPESLNGETFSERGAFEPPLYTRPADFEGRSVPEVLRSGDHAAIDRWRHEQAEVRLRHRRPDLVRDGATREEVQS
jgi:tRNA (guanine37-N1)-methyltransferase